MKCDCGAEMTSAKENYRYDESGLPNVTLVRVEIRRCAACGEQEVVIPKIEQLHRVLAMTVVHKAARFTGAEVRFLRKFLGWSGADFARHIGGAPEMVSRWENDKIAIGATYDRLLRLLVANQEPVSHYPVEELERIADESRPAFVRASVGRGGWSTEAGATA